MNMSDILKKSLFFTGAGFSKPAGCKLSREMLTDLEKESRENENLFTPLEKKVIKFVLSCLEYQSRWRTLETDGKYSYNPNIEEFTLLLRRIKNRENLLPYPVTGNWSDKIISLEQKFLREGQKGKQELNLYDSIEYKIKNDLYEKWFNKIDLGKLDFLKPIENFLRELPNTSNKLDIFTLNYDLLLEKFFQEENSIYSGFVSNKWMGFNLEDVDGNTFNASRINYYKMHGSLDWKRLLDGSVTNKERNENLVEEIEIDPFLIFGHGSKLFTIEPFFALLEMFKKKLREKNFYFVIGYSFFDPHINNLFFNEILSSTNRDKVLIIINPCLLDSIKDKDEKKLYYSKFGIKDKKVLKREYKTEVINFLFEIQKNPLYSDMPDFNLTKIAPENFEYIKLNTTEFIQKFFQKKDGNYFIESFIENIESQKSENQKIF